jgi:hypothetical protein
MMMKAQKGQCDNTHSDNEEEKYCRILSSGRRSGCRENYEQSLLLLC